MGKDCRIIDATPPALAEVRRRCCRCGLYRPDGLRHVCGSIAAAWLLRRADEQLSRCARAVTSVRPVAARHDHYHQHHAPTVRRDRAHLPPALPPLFGAARCRAMLAMIAIIILICTIYYTYNIVQYGININHLCTVSDGQYCTFSGNF